MGWNSWNCFANSVTADKIKAAADALVNSGLIDHGWTYINIDDFGRCIVIQTTPRFRGRIAMPTAAFCPIRVFRIWRADRLRARQGSQDRHLFGARPPTRGGCVGSFGYELQDAQQYAEWGFDYLKYDWCSYNPAFEAFRAATTEPFLKAEHYLYRRRSGARQTSIQADAGGAGPTTARYYLQSLPVWYGQRVEWGTEVGGNPRRTTQDITDTWASMAGIGFAQAGLEKYAGPGHFNDPDMLVVGKVGWGPQLRNSRLLAQRAVHPYQPLCLLASPLLIGCDMTQLDEFTLNLLTNDEVIEVNQDPLGRQAGRIAQNGTLEVWAKDMEDGSQSGRPVQSRPA